MPARILAVAIVIFMPVASATGQATAQLKRVRLTDQLAGPADAQQRPEQVAMSGLAVVAEVLDHQKDPANGLRVKLTIANRGPGSVSLLDPATFLQVIVLNERGMPIGLPPVPTGGLICTKPQARPWGTGGDRRPFHLLDRAKTDAQDDRPRVDDGVLRLEPGRQHTMLLRVTEVLAEPDRYFDQQAKRTQVLDELSAKSPAPVPAKPIGPGD